MKRQTAGLTALLLLALAGSACSRDEVTGIPELSVNGPGATALRDVILVSTDQFGSQSQLVAMQPDGTGRRRITNDDHGYIYAAISPNGRRLAVNRFTSDDHSEGIFVMNADASGQTLLVNRSSIFDGQATWSPDGCRIAFQSWVDGPFGPFGRIFVINADGTGLRQVSPDVGSNDYQFDEGPSWSPDGTRIVFTRSAVLHVINADGTGFTALPNEDLAQSAAWSPDGSRIVYQALDGPGTIRIRNADGSNPVTVSNRPEQQGNPRWSPDGRQIVFGRVIDERFLAFRINVDGTGERQLSPGGFGDFLPTWSSRPATSAACDAGVRLQVTPSMATLGVAETQQLTATVRSASGSIISGATVTWSSTNAAVVTVDQSGLVAGVGSGQAQIRATFANAEAIVAITVSKRSVLRNFIVYATEEFGLSSLSIVHPDGSGRERLTTDQFGYFGGAVSPDGRRIAFPSFQGIYVMNADGTGTRLVVSRGFFIDGSPAWSRDGSQIAFRSMVDGPFGAAGRIFVVNVDGSGLRQLSPDDPDPNVFYYFDDSPTWSPDGSRIAFSRFGELTLINADGSGLTSIPTPDGASEPTWSPDGTRLAYTSWKTTRDIFVSNADGSNAARVTTAPEQENSPSWSPDSRRLVFCRVLNGFFQLFTIGADGSGEARLTANPDVHECGASWSPVP